MGKRPVAAAGLVVVLLGAACAPEERGPAAPGPDSPVTAPPRGTPPPPDTGPIRVSPREGLVDVRPRPWEEVETLSSRRLLVHFWSGVEECYGLDRVEVEETAEAVTITLFEGRDPRTEVCIEIAIQKAVEALLDAPLGHRELVDGAAPDPR